MYNEKTKTFKNRQGPVEWGGRVGEVPKGEVRLGLKKQQGNASADENTLLLSGLFSSLFKNSENDNGILIVVLKYLASVDVPR